MKEIKTGRIIKGIGGFYYVDDGKSVITCRACGKLRKLRIVPYVGDIVDVEIQSDSTGYVVKIHDRSNLMKRPPVANLDAIAIVVSEAPPKTDTYFIDKIISMANLKGIKVCIVINKCDVDFGENLFEIYSKVNVDVFRVSALNGEGIECLNDFIRGKFVAFTGNSGVGKSSLINRIVPELGLETGNINEKIGRGKHTTRQVEIIKAFEDSWIADTPGFSVFDIAVQENVSSETLEDLFPEFADYKDECRYVGCSHTKEADCAVSEAVGNGKISQSRYNSYCKLYEELSKIPKYKQNTNERNTI